ncbi:hypothetical protein Sango_0799600 [Sesamum angolense]|uniref:ATP-dependent DNA helicase n=1 Tax=Sesamum angolense TaxID=2727404 RepID=A0AAE1X307_9LAMI|nr:hypothetical protein Sango_0799600 [Sesamum angolense]
MLVIFDEDDKLNNLDGYDCIVKSEIPKQNEEPELYAAVTKHMIHGSCGHTKPNAPCMNNERCKKGYPKQFVECTMQGNDSYPIYQRRNDNRSRALDNNGEVVVDNSWVVPYNPWLLLKYDCHINVEVCSSIKSVKYLYKYVYKGPDCVVFERRSTQKVIGQVHAVSPNEGERLYLHVMLNHIKGPKSFDDLSTVDGVHYLTFNQAAEKRGLLQEDNSIKECLVEARSFRMPSALRSQAIRQEHYTIFFVDVLGGIGIAANLLPGGRTAHSKLKIPIKFEPLSMCRFSKQSELSTSIECASAIVWDEAPMANRKAFETVDRTFRDILGVDLLFGGKVMILGGEFWQVLPVVIGGTKSQIINASIVQSSLWSNVKLLHLPENMRAQMIKSSQTFCFVLGMVMKKLLKVI